MDLFVFEITPWFQWLIRSTLHASVIVCLVIAIKALLSAKLTPRWHYYIWMVLIARMLMPAAPQSTVSIFNLIPQAAKFFQPAEPAPAITDPVLILANYEIDSTPAIAIEPAVAIDSSTTPIAAETPAYTPVEHAASPTPTQTTQASSRLKTFNYKSLLQLAWLIGAIALAIYVYISNVRLWSIVRRQRPVTDSGVLDLLEDCKARMRIHTYLSVVETDKVTSPALFGFVRPRLLLPKGILEKLTPEQLGHVFMHELAHLKRGDIHLGWVMAFLQTLHWFNPLVWIAFHKMRADRELACDQLALASIQNEEPNEYGKTMVNLLENFSAPRYNPGLAGILEERSQLKRRITMIAKHKKGSYRFSAIAAVVMILLSAIVLTNAKDKSSVEDKKVNAGNFVDLLINEQFEEAVQNFDDKTKNALPPDRLAEVWKATTGQAGQFQKKLGTRAEKYLWTDIVYVTCRFEEGPIDVKVIYNRDSKISGLWFLPVPQNVLEQYADQPDVTIVREDGKIDLSLNLHKGQIFRYRSENMIIYSREHEPTVKTQYEYRFEVLETRNSSYLVQQTIDRALMTNLSSDQRLSVIKGGNFKEIDDSRIHLLLCAYMTDHPIILEIDKHGKIVKIVNKKEFIEGFSKFRTTPDFIRNIKTHRFTDISLTFPKMAAMCNLPQTPVAIGDTWKHLGEPYDIICKLVGVDGKIATIDVTVESNNEETTINNSVAGLRLDITTGLTVDLTSEGVTSINDDMNATTKTKVTRIDDTLTNSSQKTYILSSGKPAAQVEPKLEFLSWHKTDPDRYWQADGTVVFGAEDLRILNDIRHPGCGDSSHPDYDWLKLAFSHPLFDTKSYIGLRMIDGTGKQKKFVSVTATNARNPEPGNGNRGWIMYTVSLGAKADFPQEGNFELDYAIGNWKTEIKKMQKDYNGIMTFGSGFLLGGIGQNSEGKTTISYTHKKTETSHQQHRFVAVTQDGILEPSGQTQGGYPDMFKNEYKFDVPLKDIKYFQFQTRKVKTKIFKSVSLHPASKTAVRVTEDSTWLEGNVSRATAEILIKELQEKPKITGNDRPQRLQLRMVTEEKAEYPNAERLAHNLGHTQPRYLFVQGRVLFDEFDFIKAEMVNAGEQPLQIVLQLTTDAAERLKVITSANIKRRMVIVLDGKILAVMPIEKSEYSERLTLDVTALNNDLANPIVTWMQNAIGMAKAMDSRKTRHPDWSQADHAFKRAMDRDTSYDRRQIYMPQLLAIKAWEDLLKRRDLTEDQRIFALWRAASLYASNFDPSLGEKHDFKKSKVLFKKVRDYAPNLMSSEISNAFTQYSGHPVSSKKEKARVLAESYKLMRKYTDKKIANIASRINRYGYLPDLKFHLADGATIGDLSIEEKKAKIKNILKHLEESLARKVTGFIKYCKDVNISQSLVEMLQDVADPEDIEKWQNMVLTKKDKPKAPDTFNSHFGKTAEQPQEHQGWGKANNGLQIRLIVSDNVKGFIPVITEENMTARLEVRNVSDKPIKLAEHNNTSGHSHFNDDWLLGLTINGRLPGCAMKHFVRAGDQDYWSRIIMSPSSINIDPGKKAVLKIRLNRLVDSDGINLLTLLGRCDLQPVLQVHDDKYGLWCGRAVGEYIPATINYKFLMEMAVDPYEETKAPDTLNSQKTLRDVLNENNIGTEDADISFIDKAVTGYSVLNDPKVFCIAFYLNSKPRPFNEIYVKLFDKKQNKWTQQRIDFETVRAVSRFGPGSIVGVTHALDYVYLKIHRTPSACYTLVLTKDLKFHNVLYGWPLKAFDDGTLVYHNSQVHFAPTHSAEISIYNPHTKIDKKIYPSKPYSKIRTDHIRKVKAAYEKTGTDWFRINNHHMDPERFNNHLRGEVAIDNEKRSLSFVIGYNNKDFGGEGITEVLHVYENIDAKKIKSSEILNPPSEQKPAAKVDDKKVTLIWPIEGQAKEPAFDNYKPNMRQYPPAPDGFNISPMEISGAFSPRKHGIYIYADSKYYYVLLRQPSWLSTAKNYGFRIDGRTGEGYLPRKRWPSIYPLPKYMMSGWAETGLKSKYGTEADKLEAALHKKIRKYMDDLENHIGFDRLSITVGADFKSADCRISGLSHLVKKQGRQPIKGQLQIKYVEPEQWEITGSGYLENVKITYGTTADKVEKIFYEAIIKSLAKSNVRFDGMDIAVEPDLKWAGCSWINGLTQCKNIEGTEVWERIKGHLSIENIDRVNWKISGSEGLAHIKIDINIEQILSSLPGSILEYRLVADMKPEQAKKIPCPKSGLAEYIWLPVASQVSDSMNVNLPYRRIADVVYLLVSNKPKQTMLADGSWSIKETSVTNYRPGKPAVHVRFNKKGKQKMQYLDRRYHWEKLAVCVDGEIISESIPISHLITGNFTEDYVKKLAKLLLNGRHLKSKNIPTRKTLGGEK
jgi:bla regulator protein BlaR1